MIRRRYLPAGLRPSWKLKGRIGALEVKDIVNLSGRTGVPSLDTRHCEDQRYMSTAVVMLSSLASGLLRLFGSCLLPLASPE